MIIRIDYPEAQSRLDLWGGVSGTFAGVDRFNRVIDQRWTSTSSVESQNNVTTTPADIDRYQYGYDRDSNRVWKKNVVADAASVPLDEFYTYDALNRLATMQRGTLNGTHTGITGTPALEQDWTLDPTGNWRGFVNKTAGTTDLNQARGANPVNEITSISATTGPAWVTPAYDAAGNTTTFPQPDPTRGFTATYDAWNRMTAVSDGTTPVAKYAYDGRNRRVVSQSYTGGTLTETRHAYYTSGWQNIEERVGSATTPDTQHVWGLRYIDELVCRDDATPRRIYACQDANFNVTALVGTSGSVLQRFVYEPYGIHIVASVSFVPTSDLYSFSLRMSGRPLDAVSELFYFRSRFYIPGLGRFLSRDSAEYVDGENLYEYTLSDPISLVDPTGGRPQPPTQPTSQPTTGPAPYTLPKDLKKLEDEFEKRGSCDKIDDCKRPGWVPKWPSDDDAKKLNFQHGDYARTMPPAATFLNPDLKGKCCLTACILAGELKHIQNIQNTYKTIEKLMPGNILGRRGAANAYYDALRPWTETEAATEALSCLAQAAGAKQVGRIKCTETPDEIQDVIAGLEKLALRQTR